MAIQIQLRRGTTAQWAEADPILSAGEPGYETDTNKIKYGDGTTNWNDLPYSGAGIAAEKWEEPTFTANIVDDILVNAEFTATAGKYYYIKATDAAVAVPHIINDPASPTHGDYYYFWNPDSNPNDFKIGDASVPKNAIVVRIYSAGLAGRWDTYKTNHLTNFPNGGASDNAAIDLLNLLTNNYAVQKVIRGLIAVGPDAPTITIDSVTSTIAGGPGFPPGTPEDQVIVVAASASDSATLSYQWQYEDNTSLAPAGTIPKWQTLNNSFNAVSGAQTSTLSLAAAYRATYSSQKYRCLVFAPNAITVATNPL